MYPNESTNEPLVWNDCPAGELQDLSRRLRSAERKRQQAAMVRTVSATAACSAAMVLAIGFLVGGPAAINPISCESCQAAFASYHGHLAEGLAMTSPTADEMGMHLGKCEWCRDMYNDKYPGELEDKMVVKTANLELRPRSSLGFAAH